MRRAGCKGRTLVLKIKLHTYEVVTRQTVVPRAINLADDLFNYSVPILAKLEQDMPGMKIRLMGLRCTHLVSTKRPDTTAFFGLKPGTTATINEPGKVLRVTTQVDDEHVSGIVSGELPAQDDDDEVTAGGEIRSPQRRRGKEILPNPPPAVKAHQAPVDWWECPICSRLQPADERKFNSHIDTCLSRETIRDAVQQEQQATSSRCLTPEPKGPMPGPEKKRGRQGPGQDPKQKKLCFR
jgi:DNA polymerase kappa